MTLHHISDAAAVGVDVDNPWPGLAAFREEEQEFFRGREGKTRELLAAVENARLAILHGLSGLGKTSLLHAGLFPRLVDLDIIPIPIRLNFLPNAPPLSEQISAAIPIEIRKRGGEAPEATPNRPLWEYFHCKDSELWTQRNRPAVCLLALDQFEEIFTLGKNHPSRDRLLTDLAELVEGRVPFEIAAEISESPGLNRRYEFDRQSCKVLLILREDYLSELEDLKRKIPSLATNRVRLGRMNGEEARSVIRVGSHLIERSAEDRLIGFVAGSQQPDRSIIELEIDPALLSVFCRELNEKRIAKRESWITSNLIDGNREEILSGFYERALEGVEYSVRVFIEEHLVTASGFRQPQGIDNALGAPGMTEHVIDTLAKRRLLQLEARGGTLWIELTHDILTSVVRRNRDERRTREAAQSAIVKDRQAAQQLFLAFRLKVSAIVIVVLSFATGLASFKIGSLLRKATESHAQIARAEAAEAKAEAAEVKAKTAETAAQTAATKAEAAEAEAEAAAAKAETAEAEAEAAEAEAETAAVKAKAAEAKAKAAAAKAEAAEARAKAAEQKANIKTSEANAKIEEANETTIAASTKLKLAQEEADKRMKEAAAAIQNEKGKWETVRNQLYKPLPFQLEVASGESANGDQP